MKKGFAIIELMTVVFILGVLASFFAPKYLWSVKNAQQTQCFANRMNIQKAQMLYTYDHNGQAAESVNQLYEAGYLDKKPYCSQHGEYVFASTNPIVLACSVHYWPFTTQNEEEQKPSYDYSSDFENMDGLNLTQGKWGAKDGYLYNIGTGVHKLFFDDEKIANLKDYTINLTASSNGPYGIYYRADGEKKTDGYLFYTNGTKLYVYTSVNDKLKSIISTTLPKGFSMYNQSHGIEISVNGNQHSVKIDGKEYLNFKDSTFTSGQTGLYTNSKETQFDAVKIVKI